MQLQFSSECPRGVMDQPGLLSLLTKPLDLIVKAEHEE
jgi:hypothetical protein